MTFLYGSERVRLVVSWEQLRDTGSGARERRAIRSDVQDSPGCWRRGGACVGAVAPERLRRGGARHPPGPSRVVRGTVIAPMTVRKDRQRRLRLRRGLWPTYAGGVRVPARSGPLRDRGGCAAVGERDGRTERSRNRFLGGCGGLRSRSGRWPFRLSAGGGKVPVEAVLRSWRRESSLAGVLPSERGARSAGGVSTEGLRRSLRHLAGARGRR